MLGSLTHTTVWFHLLERVTMQSSSSEKSLLLRRRAKTLTVNKRVRALKLELSENQNDGDIDDFKKEFNFNDWLHLTKRAYRKRPTLALSPSFLLSPVCFSPLYTPEGIISPFCHLEKQIHIIPKLESPSTSSTPQTSSSVFTFERDVPTSKRKENGRKLCPIPEERPLSYVDMLYCSAHLDESFLYRREKTYKPPMSPSFLIATSCKRKARIRNKAANVNRPKDEEHLSTVTSAVDDAIQEKEQKQQRCSQNGETGKKNFSFRHSSGTQSMSKNGFFSSMVGC